MQTDPGPLASDPAIVWLFEDLTEGQINALYRLTHVYVSPHHGEGWGLTLSDAMLFGKAVIATAFGNLEFMPPDNSYLLDYVEDYIREEDRFRFFTGDMEWAYPDEQDLDRTVQLTYDTLGSSAAAAKVQRATAEIARFDRQHVRPLLAERIARLTHA